MKDNQNNNSFKIESGVTIPLFMGERRSWPFNQMAIGDSFILSPEEATTHARSAASIFGRRNNQRFTIRRVSPNEYRCWRVS